MSECFLCSTALDQVNDAEIEGVELCVDCCDRLDAVVVDYLTSSPGGIDLLLDIVTDDLENPEGKLREPLMNMIREALAEQ